MRFEEKLRERMASLGFNQQRLARESSVSDSEISRILTGKSTNPGVDNALRLARAVGVSLDYLVDHDLGTESVKGAAATETEREILEVAAEIGHRQARRILETVLELGYEVAIRRLLEMKPLIEVGDPPRAVPSGSPSAGATSDRRASRA